MARDTRWLRAWGQTATLLVGPLALWSTAGPGAPAQARGGPAPSPERATEMRRVADHILACQLPNGLIAMTPDQKLWAVPYFASLAALGLLRAHQVTREPRYIQAVLRYADWHAEHINPDGTIYDFVGTRSEPAPTGDYDSSDAYPALYLALGWETFRVTRDRAWLREKYASLVQSVEGMRLTWQPDGLTFGKPNYRVKYLMDNLEVRNGLRAAVRAARVLRDGRQAAAWTRLLDENRRGLTLLWLPEKGRFAMAMFEDGKRHEEFAKWYPDGMANAMALAYILDPRDPKARALSAAVDQAFASDADYWRFVALWKMGPRERALRVRDRMRDHLVYSLDYGLYLRALAPELEGFFYGEERLRLPDLQPARR